jgi:hypothetical protein
LFAAFKCWADRSAFWSFFGNYILPRAPSRVQKLATNEFPRLTIDASSAELREEKSLKRELIT